MTATFTHSGGSINTVTITFTYNNCVTQLDSDNKNSKQSGGNIYKHWLQQWHLFVQLL